MMKKEKPSTAKYNVVCNSLQDAAFAQGIAIGMKNMKEKPILLK